MNEDKRTSDARRVYDLIMRDCMATTAWSLERIGRIRRESIVLVIAAGLRCEPEDFSEWGLDEYYYALALVENNIQACQAFEKAAKRPPFIAARADAGGAYPRFAHYASSRKNTRLAVGSRFRWQGEEVKVTSFAKDGTHLVACSYKDKECVICDRCHRCLHGGGPDKINRRYKITPEQLRAERKRQKEETI